MECGAKSELNPSLFFLFISFCTVLPISTPATGFFFFLRSYCIILRLSNAVGVFVPCDYYLRRPNASVNSSCARPPSPPADPRADSQALAFFLPWMANSRGWGLLSCQIPRGRDEKRGQTPRPPSTLQHFSMIAQSNNAVLSILTCDFLFQFLSSFVIALGF